MLFPFTAQEATSPQNSPSWDDGYLEIADPIPETTRPKLDTGARIGNGSCVAYVKYRLKLEGIWRTPKFVWDNAQSLGFSKTETPIAGSIVILSEGYVWHMAVIESADGDTIRISEQNYLPGRVGERILPITYDKIIGFLI